MRGFLSTLNDIFEPRMKISVAAAILFSTLLALLDMAAVSLVLPLVDLLTGAPSVPVLAGLFGEPPPERLLGLLALTVAGLFLLKDLGAILYAWWFAGFKAMERVHLQTRLLANFLEAPYTAISRRSSADMLRSLTEAVTQVFGSAVFGLVSAVTNLISIVAIAAALLLAAPLPTLAALAYFGLAATVYVVAIKPVATRAGRASAAAAQDGFTTALAALGGLKELSLRETQHVFVERFREATLRGARAGRTAEFLAGLPRYLLEILFIVAVGLAIAANQLGGTTVGLLSLFVAGGFRILPSINGLLGNLAQFRFGRPYLDIVHAEIRDARRLRAAREAAGPPLPFEESLRLEDVSFRYPGAARDVLTGVSLTIPYRTSCALVGASGAGKTTLADLILGLHDPTAGRVLVDGQDIAGRKRRWQHSVGYVPQDSYLLDATLAENIAFDQPRPHIDDARLRTAIAAAHLEEWVAGLPDGVDTQVGERGARLSGGQRQRVGIARSLFRRPRLLVLDEATSALDSETERRITETIAHLRGEMTVIVIAHRLSTVKDCDQIAFLQDGRVAAVGSFGELVRSCPDFAALVRLGSLASPDDGRP